MQELPTVITNRSWYPDDRDTWQSPPQPSDQGWDQPTPSPPPSNMTGKPCFPAENLAKRSHLIRMEWWGNSSWWDLGQDTGLDFSKKSLSWRPHTQEKERSSPRLKGDEGFPGGSGVKNAPAEAGDTGSILDSGRPHMLQSNQAREPQLPSPRALEPVVSNQSHRPDETPMRPQRAASAPTTGEKPTHGHGDPVQPKVNKHIKLFKK